MIELSLKQWGDMLLKTRKYITVSYNYDEKYSLVKNSETNIIYKATYNLKSGNMELRRVRK